MKSKKYKLINQCNKINKKIHYFILKKKYNLQNNIAIINNHNFLWKNLNDDNNFRFTISWILNVFYNENKIFIMIKKNDE